MELGVFSLSLTVKDIAASRQVYEKFGFKVFHQPPGGRWMILKNGKQIIGLQSGLGLGRAGAAGVYRCPRSVAPARPASWRLTRTATRSWSISTSEH